MYESVYIKFHSYVNEKIRSNGKMNSHGYFYVWKLYIYHVQKN